jgi:Homing endonuclease associated repeat
MTKNEIVKTICSFAKTNGRNPSIRDITHKTKVTRHFIYEQFGSWRKALAAAGLKAGGPGMAQPESALMLDWAAATRKLGKIPSVYEYERAGRFSNVPFQTRYRRWKDVPDAFAKFARKDGVDQEWWDVLAMIDGEKESRALQPGKGRRSQKEIVLRDRPIYGDPLGLPELAYAPVNEAGVVFAFGMAARKLGFTVHRIQTEFPDCEAMRRVARGQWQRVRIEFEFESRNFLKHGHNPKGCDVIVCWVDNWPDRPKNLQVIELSKVLRRIG